MSIKNTFVWFNPRYPAPCLAFKKLLSNTYSLVVHSLILHEKCMGEKAHKETHASSERDKAMVKEFRRSDFELEWEKEFETEILQIMTCVTHRRLPVC